LRSASAQDRRERPVASRILLLVAAAALASGSLTDAARADGDPASDYLLTQRVFFPFDVRYPRAEKAKLVELVAAANRQGFKVRIALIPDQYDLGSVTALWRRPQTYARFLGVELSFVYKQRLLVVMPNGYGFNWPGHPSKLEHTALATIPPPGSPASLPGGAILAVERLAVADGVTVDASTRPTTSDSGQSRSGAFVGAAAVGVLLLAGVLGGLALRRLRSSRR
jgi:hypothetical protein